MIINRRFICVGFECFERDIILSAKCLILVDRDSGYLQYSSNVENRFLSKMNQSIFIKSNLLNGIYLQVQIYLNYLNLLKNFK